MYIKLYADEFSEEVWESYCKALQIPSSSTEVKVNVSSVEVFDQEGENNE